MKRFFILIILILLYISNVFSMIENQDTTYKLYKVYDIQRVKNGFVVVLCDEVNNYYFDVASLKANFKFKAKIKKGESYYFALFPYFNKTYTPNHAVNYNVKIKNKVIVVKSKSWTGNVYTTPNLDGLYYLPLNK